MARRRKQRRLDAPAPPSSATEASGLPSVLARVSVVTSRVHLQVGSLSHAVSSISSFLDCSGKWTLETASDAGLVPLLDRLHARQWSGVSDDFRDAQFLRAIRLAATKGQLEVLAWWKTKYHPNGWSEETQEAVVRIAAFHGHLPLLECLLKDERSLQTIVNMSRTEHDQPLICQHPEIVHWVHDRSRLAKVYIWLDKSIEQGDLEFLKWVHKQRKRHRNSFGDGCISKAAEAGHLEVLQWLNKHEDDWFSEMAMHSAAKGGHLELLKWLESVDSERPDFQGEYKLPGSEAAQNGHLDVVKWLVEECDLFFSEASTRFYWHARAMDAAIEAGDRSMLDYLSNNRPFECTTRGLTKATVRGDLEMVKWLHENGFKSTGDPKEYAAEHGHLAILQWLFEISPESTEEVMNCAVSNNHLNVVKWLHGNQAEGCTDAAMIIATSKGYFEMVKWLRANRPEFGPAGNPDSGEQKDAIAHGHIPATAITFAAAQGYLDILKFFLVDCNENCTTHIMDVAASSGYLDIVQWLHAHRAEGCTQNAMNFAASNGHLNVVRWLHKNRTEGCTVEAMNEAAAHGHLHVVRWLMENRTEGFSNYGLNEAVANGHRDVVILLVASQPGLDLGKIYLDFDAKMASVRPDLKLDYSYMMRAMNEDHFEVVEWLEQHTPDLIGNGVFHMMNFHEECLLESFSSTDELMMGTLPVVSRWIYDDDDDDEDDDNDDNEDEFDEFAFLCAPLYLPQ